MTEVQTRSKGRIISSSNRIFLVRERSLIVIMTNWGYDLLYFRTLDIAQEEF